jgi:hypothetical protein
LAALARWVVVVAAAGVLALVAAANLIVSPWRVFGLWWLVSSVGLVAMALLWRLAGPPATKLWRSLKLPRWALPTVLFFAFLVVKLIPALGLKTEQSWDFLAIYEAAKSLVAGDNSFTEIPYWDYFAYQTPSVLYEAGMLKLSGGSTVPLLVVGAMAMAGINLLVFLAGRRITGSASAGLLAAIAYLVFPGPYIQAPALSTDHLSTFLTYLGAYIILAAAARTRLGQAVALGLAGGLALELGNLIRPMGPVMLAAALAAVVVGVLTRRRCRPAAPPHTLTPVSAAGADAPPEGAAEPAPVADRGAVLGAATGVAPSAATRAALDLTPSGKRPANDPPQPGRQVRPLVAGLAAALVALGAYTALGVGVDGIVRWTGVNPHGTKSNLPEWKFALGLAGRDEAEDVLVMTGAYDQEPAPNAHANIRAALKRDLELLRERWFYIAGRQVQLLWVNHDNAILAFNPQLADLKPSSVPNARTDPLPYLMVVLERGLALPVVILAAWGVVQLGRERRVGRVAAFLACLVIAYAAIHLAIEAMPRYRYPVMPAIFTLTAPALGRLAGVGPRREGVTRTTAPPRLST